MAQQAIPQDAPGARKVKKRANGSKKIDLRLIAQIFFFVLVASIAVNHSLEQQGKAVGFLS